MVQTQESKSPCQIDALLSSMASMHIMGSMMLPPLWHSTHNVVPAAGHVRACSRTAHMHMQHRFDGGLLAHSVTGMPRP